MTGPGDSDTALGDWVLGGPIGSGTGTVVHRGHHRLHPDRVVAIKRIILDQATTVRPDTVDALRREAEALAQLSHPAVIPFTDVVADGASLALVMPLAPGGSLGARLRSGGALPWRDVADLGGRIASGLAAAHGIGIVHRDVTPDNILLGRDLEPRLADFGSALLGSVRAVRSDVDRERVVGTPGYLDPMVTRGTPANPASDVYGLGVVLYEALAGQPPFGGATPEAVQRSADRGIHLPLADLVPGAPLELTATIERAMARDPADRFGSAQALQVALEHVALTVVDPDLGSGVVATSGSRAGRIASEDVGEPAAGESAAGEPAAGAQEPVDAEEPAHAEGSGRAGGPALEGEPAAAAALPTAAAALPPAAAGPPTAVGGMPGTVAGRFAVAATTDFGPRPIAMLDVEQPRRPWWVVVALVAVVVVPVASAAWAVLSARVDGVPAGDAGATAIGTPATVVATAAATDPVTPNATTPATGGPTAPATATSTDAATALVPRVPAPPCDDQSSASDDPAPATDDQSRATDDQVPGTDDQSSAADDQVLGDVDGRGCSLPITVVRGEEFTTLALPDEAGAIAGDYLLEGPPAHVVVGDWDGDGIDTPAVTLDDDGVVFGFAAWGAGQSTAIGDPIGPAAPLVVTGSDGVDRVVADAGG